MLLNKAAENQAMDRIHRIGQTRPVRCIRFLMRDSIEERFIKYQNSKEALGKGSMEKLSHIEQRKAKLTQLKDLFQVNDEEVAWSA